MGRQKHYSCNKIKVAIMRTQERLLIQIKHKCGQKSGRPPWGDGSKAKFYDLINVSRSVIPHQRLSFIYKISESHLFIDV